MTSPEGRESGGLDTSGYVEHPKGSTDVSAIYWSDLTPFAQGYIEALLASVAWPEPSPGRVLNVRFSILARETLARIIEDCAAHLSLGGAWRVAHAEAGRIFWRGRQAGIAGRFPPLTITLSDDGKVYLS